MNSTNYVWGIAKAEASAPSQSHSISVSTDTMIQEANMRHIMRHILSILLLTSTVIHTVNASNDTTITMDIALDYAWTTFKILFACSPIIAIIAILALAREDDEEEAAKRKIKCARS